MLSIVTILILVSTYIEQVTSVRGTRIDFSRSCEPIKIDLCRGVGYNVTAMPNFIGHELQQDAELQIQTFAPLIQYGCSGQLKFFLCSVYVPMCNEKVPDNIGPCRPLCQQVRDRCEPVLLEFGFPWPSALECDLFPAENNHQHMCMEGPGESELDPIPSSSVVPIVPRPLQPSKPFKPSIIHPPLFVPTEESILTGQRPKSTSVHRSDAKANFNNLCTKLKFSKEYVYINRTERCGHKCGADILFNKDNKTFSEYWLLTWSLICCILTAFTIITFIIDPAQFKYPERVIVIIATTYFLLSLGSIARVTFGREEVACHIEKQHNTNLLIQEGPDNIKCTVVFVLLHYFWNASMAWWVNLTIMWFMSSGLNWSPEVIERKSSYFHGMAWTVPLLQTIAILVFRAIDADELTGLCFVGYQSTSTLLIFVIIPSAFYISVGVTFLILRYYYILLAKQQKVDSSLRVRHPSHHSSSSSHHSGVHHWTNPVAFTTGLGNCCNPRGSEELLHARISFFTYFYLFPAIWILVTNIYEYINRDSWYQSVSHGHPASGHWSQPKPNVEIFTLKIFFSFVAGILSGLWIWSSKSPVAMWSRTFCRGVGKPSSIGTVGSIGTINKQPIPQSSLSQSNYFMTLPLSTPTPSIYHGNAIGPFPSCPNPSLASSTLSRHVLAAHNKAQQQQHQQMSTMDMRNNRMLYGIGKGGETTV